MCAKVAFERLDSAMDPLDELFREEANEITRIGFVLVLEIV